MPDITPEQRAELRLLEAAATPGEWIRKCLAYRNGQIGRTGEHYWIVQRDGETTLPMDSAGDPKAEFNAALIAAARNALPALLDIADERDALRARLAEIEKDRDAARCEVQRLSTEALIRTALANR